MKKTIPITLSKILFYVEEDAFIRLSAYLDSIKVYFSSYPDNVEIINDIENRIAEQFLENQNKNNIITLKDVERLISSMGNVEDFGETNENTINSSFNKKERKERKLFRNPDDAIIAGVASGLGAYFGIDTVLVRLIFIFIVFLGGSGIFIYIILWLIIPEAKTSTEKLQMRGEPITLESVNELLKEKVGEVKKNSGSLYKAINSFFIVFGKIIKVIFSILGKLIGVLLTLSFSFCIFALLFTFAVVIFNIQSPYIDFPLLEMGNQFLIILGISALFFALIIPFVFLVLFGIKIFGKKKIFRPIVTFSLIGIWCISIITIGIVGVRIIPEYKNIEKNNQISNETTVDFPLTDFEGIVIQNGNNVSITEGDTFKISATGKVKSVDNLFFQVKDNTLTISKKDNFNICIFCFNRTPNIDIILPKLTNISLANGSVVTASGINADDFKVKLSNGSNIKLTINAKNLIVGESNGSLSSIVGRVTTASFDISNASRVEANELITINTIVEADNGSKARVYTEKKLKVDLQNGSTVIYSGKPTIIEKKLINGSRLQTED
jgi:phage shock protein PspC (stress-responsive transcriptional regulator)